jgi:acyl-coenzyme A thioesterase PaaI-like protein
MDQALAFAAMTVLPNDKVFRTTNLSVNFIRTGKGESLLIEASVVAQTKQMLTTRALIWRADGELIAEASAQQLLQPIQPTKS